MKTLRPFLCHLLTACLFISCSSSTKHRIPNPNAYELTGEKYYVTLKNGRTLSTRHIEVKRDSAFFNDKKIKLTDIRSIETKEFSPIKTLGLIAGVGAATFLAIQFLIAYMLIMGHTASK